MKLAKRLLPLVFVCALALAFATQALADPTPSTGPSATPQSFTCLGRVTATTPSSVTVTVRRASCALQGSLSQSLTLAATDQSVISELVQGAKTQVSATDLPTGDFIVVRGTIDASTTPPAYDITTACAWQARFHTRFLCVGQVSSVNLDPAYLVVTVGARSLGLPRFLHKQITIDVPSSAAIFCLQRGAVSGTTFDQITAGDRVWIAGSADRSDPGSPVFTARRVLVHHPVPVAQLTWYACCGQVSSVDTNAGTVSVTVAHATRALHSEIGSDVTLTVCDSSVMRTLADGVVTTVTLADLAVGESIVVAGAIDRSDAADPIYDIGHAFVWQPVVSDGLLRNAA